VRSARCIPLQKGFLDRGKDANSAKSKSAAKMVGIKIGETGETRLWRLESGGASTIPPFNVYISCNMETVALGRPKRSTAGNR
jgi:hypothetical protein